MKNRSTLWLIIGAGLAIAGMFIYLFSSKKAAKRRKKIRGKGKGSPGKIDKFPEGTKTEEEFEPKLFIQSERRGDMV